MKLDLDTEIRYQSGERAGFLRKVVLNEHNQATAIVMGTDGLISRKVIVPVSMLSEGPGGVTYINTGPDGVGELVDYEEEIVPAVGEGWETGGDIVPLGEVFPLTTYEPNLPVMETSNVAGDNITLTEGTEIWCLDDRWGVVDQVLTGEDGTVQAFVGRPDDTEEHRQLIPMGLVSETDATRIVLNTTISDLTTYTEPVVDDQSEPDQD